MQQIPINFFYSGPAAYRFFLYVNSTLWVLSYPFLWIQRSRGGGGLFPTLMGPLTMPGSEQTSALTPKGSGGSSVEWLDRVRPLYVLNKKKDAR